MTEGLSERRRLHPATLIARWLRVVPQMLAGGIAITVSGRGGGGLAGFLWVAGIALAIGAVFVLISWWRFTYRIGGDEIVIEKGLLQRQRRIIPFDRIQDIAIEQPLLARLFGTAKVKIETGGAARDEGMLDMIALADARTLRDHVRRGARAEAVAESAGEPLLFAMGLPRLLLSGLFNFSLIFLAAIVAVAQQLEQFGLLDDWVTPERAEAAAGFATLRVALVAATAVVLLGLVAGVARTVARDFGFRLTRTEGGLRRKRGLFTLSEVVIPLRRTQVAVIDGGPVARLFGWYRLSFQTLGADQKEGGLQVAAPFARIDEILPILAEAGFPAPPPRAAFHGMPRRALLRRAAPYLLLAALAAIAALLVEARAGLGAAVMVAAAVYAVLRWRRHSHALDGRALFVRGGLLRRRLWIVPFEKAQTIIVSRSPVQRRLRLASLLVDTAGASAMRAPEMDDLDASEAEAMAAQLLALFHAARARLRPVANPSLPA